MQGHVKEKAGPAFSRRSVDFEALQQRTVDVEALFSPPSISIAVSLELDKMASGQDTGLRKQQGMSQICERLIL